MNTIPSDVLARIFIYVGRSRPGAAFVLTTTSKQWKAVVESDAAIDAWVLPPLEYGTLSQYNNAEEWLRNHPGVSIHAHTGSLFSTKPDKQVLAYVTKIAGILCCLESTVTQDVVPLLTALGNSTRLRQLILYWPQDSDQWLHPDITWISSTAFRPLSSLHLQNPPIPVLEVLAATPNLPQIYELYLDLRTVQDLSTLQSVVTLIEKLADRLVSLRICLTVPHTRTQSYKAILVPELEELAIETSRFGVDELPFKFVTPKLQLYLNEDSEKETQNHVDLSKVTTLVVRKTNCSSLQLCTSLHTLVICDWDEKVKEINLYTDHLGNHPICCPSLGIIHYYKFGTPSAQPVLWSRTMSDGTTKVVTILEFSVLDFTDMKYLKPRPWACPKARNISE